MAVKKTHRQPASEVSEVQEDIKNKKGTKGGMSKIAAGAAGAVAGAALGSAAAVALSDKDLRKKAGNMMQDLPEKADRALDVADKQTHKISTEARKRLEQTKKNPSSS